MLSFILHWTYEVVYLSLWDAMAVQMLNSDPIQHCTYSPVFVSALILKSSLRWRDLGLVIHSCSELGWAIFLVLCCALMHPMNQF